MKKHLFTILFLALCAPAFSFQFENGDIIFQTSLSSQSRAIQLATHSKYSHVGIVVVRHGKPFVLEAVQPVKYTPLDEWIKRGKDGKYCLKRLKNSVQYLNRGTVEKFEKACGKYIGKNYDLYFGWSDEAIYCSELVWKVYKEAFGITLCPLKKMMEFDIGNRTVKAKLAERYGGNIRRNEPVVAPSDVFNSGMLKTVECRG